MKIIEFNSESAIQRILEGVLEKSIAGADFSVISGKSILAFGFVEEDFDSSSELSAAIRLIHDNLQTGQFIAVLRRSINEPVENILEIQPSESLQKLVLFGRTPEDFDSEDRNDIQVRSSIVLLIPLEVISWFFITYGFRNY